MAGDTMIVPLLLERFKDHLTTALKTDISDDNEKADFVEVGRFQDDPTVNNIYITIQGGYLSKPEYMDGIVTLDEMHRVGMDYIPPRETGGSGQQHWWRRGTCQIGCYFIGKGLSEVLARTSAYNVFGRLSSNIENVAVSDLTDSFGETAHSAYLYATEFQQGGGPPTEYIWRGRVLWQVLTERIPIS